MLFNPPMWLGRIETTEEHDILENEEKMLHTEQDRQSADIDTDNQEIANDGIAIQTTAVENDTTSIESTSDNHPETIISTRSPSTMTEAEKKDERRRLRDRLRALNATPRSDWHREFERIIRQDARPYGRDVDIRIEEELGIDPPRVDYLILDDKKRLMSHTKAIYRIFRQHNIVEYKNPHDSLNMRVISKIIGYGNFYIGLAEHEGDRPRNEVTLSLYRDKANKELFDEMMANGKLVKTDVPGIYNVQKLTELPFQIVIGNELEGDEHAEFRLLTDHAKEEDAKIVAEKLEKSTDSREQEDGKRLFEFIEYRNPGITRTVLNELKKAEGGHEKLASILMNVLQPEIDERVNMAVTTAVDDATRTNLFLYVQDGDMLIEKAAKRANMSTADFSTAMTNAGYKLPQMANR